MVTTILWKDPPAMPSTILRVESPCYCLLEGPLNVHHNPIEGPLHLPPKSCSKGPCYGRQNLANRASRCDHHILTERTPAMCTTILLEKTHALVTISNRKGPEYGHHSLFGRAPLYVRLKSFSTVRSGSRREG